MDGQNTGTGTGTDRELVGAYAREGSETAFRALVSRHVNLVYGVAVRQVGDPGVAEEVTQNVFVALAKKAPRLAGHETLAGWLHRTAILEAKARIRAELRRRRREDTAAILATVAVEREESSPMEDLKPLLDEALLALRDGDRVALVLRFLEERSLRDVGVVLGVDDEVAGFHTGRAVWPNDHRVGFFRPPAQGTENPVLGMWLYEPGRGSWSSIIGVDDVPPLLRLHLVDWIAEAREEHARARQGAGAGNPGEAGEGGR